MSRITYYFLGLRQIANALTIGPTYTGPAGCSWTQSILVTRDNAPSFVGGCETAAYLVPYWLISALPSGTKGITSSAKTPQRDFTVHTLLPGGIAAAKTIMSAEQNMETAHCPDAHDVTQKKRAACFGMGTDGNGE